MTPSVDAPPAPRTLRNHVGGAWVDPVASDELVSRNPATGEELARVPLSSAADVERAVAAARAAQPGWAATPITVRARALMDLRTSLVAHQDELARLLATDMGKTVPDAMAEVGRGIESVEAAIAAPHLLKGQVLEGVSRGIDVEMVHQPVGVIGVITPFNFPVMLPLWFIPFALACGNAVVLKPSEQDPLCPERIVELIAGIDAIPPGLVNLVHGAHDAVNALLDSEGIDAISFVGSAETARYVASRATDAGKRVQALGGAKNSMIVAPDADRDLMVSGVLSSAFGGAGQRCLAGSVAVLVGTREQQDAALDAIVQGARGLRVGAGLDDTTDVCPVVSPVARERLEGAIAEAAGQGARVVLDGRGDAGPGGCRLGPTVLDLADTESRAARDELFGPVLSVVRVPDLDAAIDWSNGSRYGNSAILFTSSGGAAQRFRQRIEAGMLGVNIGVAAPVAWFPFAGWKDSMVGDLHANGDDAFTFYTRRKVVTSRWA
jgi:malonate-semialdehyde dehydrogenase (acetylating) / methylmalonate-semialdehyde dehydrogenase